uniref:Rab3 GTPase-activating protein catalytic subunit n=6 Tax=Parascaris univalens TaxID=6257 RepID=A0A915BEX9_PARUN
SSEGAINDEEVFEINDFTVVTALESFIVGIEATVYSWGLGKGSCNGNRFALNRNVIASCKWDSKCAKLVFGDNNALNLAYFWPRNLDRLDDKRDSQDAPSSATTDGDYLTNAAKLLLATELDFCPGSIISSQFGVLEFLLLTPFDWSSDKVVNENQLQTILSAVNVALCTTECELPVFVQYGDGDRQLYFGVCQNHSVRTHFESVHLRCLQPAHSHLSGLLEIFTDKVNCELIDTSAVRVSIQVDYKLEESLDVIPHFSSTYAQINQTSTPNELFIGSTPRLPFGAASDILDVFYLHTMWPNMRQETVNENDVYSDLDPLTAPFWTASASFQEGSPCLMNLSLKTLLDTANGMEGKLHLSGILGVAAEGETLSAQAALSSLVQPQSISITNPTGIVVEESTAIPASEMSRWINAIFTEGERLEEASTFSVSKTTSEHTSFPGEVVKEKSPIPPKTPENEEPDDIKRVRKKCMMLLEHSKASSLNSLASRIGTALAYILCHHEAGTSAFAQLWSAVVKELRKRWENGDSLPGMETDTVPDLSMSLLQQKLQMLQSCINARARQHQMLDQKGSFSDASLFSNDEFYDAKEWLSEEDSDADTSDRGSDKLIDKSEKVPSKTAQPKGRLTSLAPLCLLNEPNVTMYEPVTQERCPMTEDMLERHVDALSFLGSAEARAKVHLDSLLSDMQSFKAANPGCVFEDFVRWHSPRDYVVDETTGKGSLSSRMSGENNAWMETWSEAMPIPVVLQKRLFNETKEAETVLQEFNRVTVADLVHLILPVVLNCATMQLIDECKPIVSLIGEKLEEACEKVSRYSRSQHPEDCLDALRELLIIESTIAKYNSLWTRFIAVDDSLENNDVAISHLTAFVRSLVLMSKRDPQENALSGGNSGNFRSVPVDGGVDGPLGMAIRKLFATDVRLRDDESPSLKQRISGGKKAITGRSTREQQMPPFHRRQYVFHWLGSRRGSAPRATPHRMYASLSRKEARLCVALTDDIVFH